jgi:hypothetical protein
MRESRRRSLCTRHVAFDKMDVYARPANWFSYHPCPRSRGFTRQDVVK